MKNIEDNIYNHLKISKETLITYIENQQIDSRIRQLLLNEIQSEPNPFYYGYGSLFTDKKCNDIKHINIAGYFYFRYLLLIDKHIDTNFSHHNKIQEVMLSNWYHEESIKILSNIFSDNTLFWTYWKQRKEEYLSACIKDKQFIIHLEEDTFERLADQKSAFGKTAIDALLALQKINNPDHLKLLQSHKLFSCGLQCYDDIFDLREDYSNQQTNFALSKVLEEHKDVFPNTIEYLQKRFFLHGEASKLLHKSIDYLNKAYTLTEDIDCHLWRAVIVLKIKEIQQVITQVEYYLEALRIKTRLANEKKTIDTKSDTEESVSKGIKSGLSFIQKEQESNGSWKDSPVNGWLSGYWTTGYVLYQLEELTTIPLNTITPKAIEYLQQKKSILWPYIEGWVEDSDSSNFCLLGLLSQQKPLEESIQTLLSYQQKDGGITTYNNSTTLFNHLNDPKKTNLNGWTQSHLCVSAGTLLLLSKLDGYTQEKNKLIAYFLENYDGKKLHDAYWWTSPIYTSTLVLEASKNIQHSELEKISQSITKLLFQQFQENGLCRDAFSKEHILYSAMTLKALCRSENYTTDQYLLLRKAAQALISRQNTDGSWDSSYALRIPASDCIHPDSITAWKKTDIGENVLIEDLHRIITTSTVISALNRFLTLKL